MNSHKYLRNNLESECYLKYLTDVAMDIKILLRSKMFQAGFASTIFKELERPKSRV